MTNPVEHPNVAYLKAHGWEDLTCDGAVETWSYPWHLRSAWPKWAKDKHGTQHYWDRDEAVALQVQLQQPAGLVRNEPKDEPVCFYGPCELPAGRWACGWGDEPITIQIGPCQLPRNERAVPCPSFPQIVKQDPAPSVFTAVVAADEIESLTWAKEEAIANQELEIAACLADLVRRTKQQRSKSIATEPSPLNLDHDEARAVHRIVRAIHDGECPKCHKIHPSDRMRFNDCDDASWTPNEVAKSSGWRCSSCKFEITYEEASAAVVEFAPYMERNLAIFEKWRAARVQKS